MIGHQHFTLDSNRRRAQSARPGKIDTPRTILAGSIDSQRTALSFARVNSTQSCPLRKPFFRRGSYVQKMI
jgi:hypothetical protein